MSHIPQRKEKDCLNCGATVQGRYCQDCGQENIVPHETFWHMFTHFLYDITHFDSKFFASIKYLLLRPGFLPREYLRGRRASYLNPVKNYVFTSAIFFLLFFAFFVDKDSYKFNTEGPVSPQERTDVINKLKAHLALDSNNQRARAGLALFTDSTKTPTKNDVAKYADDFTFIDVGGPNYNSRQEYDSIQHSLPAGQRDGWLRKLIQRKNLELKEKYRDNLNAGTDKFVETFLHKLPYLLFVSLPLFALILQLLYIRRKQVYYVDHGIFSIYHYIFSFLLLLAVFSLAKLYAFTGWGIISLLTMLVFLSGGVYLFISMKRFYGQGYGKTTIKFLLLNILALAVMVVLFIALVLFSVFEI